MLSNLSLRSWKGASGFEKQSRGWDKKWNGSKTITQNIITSANRLWRWIYAKQITPTKTNLKSNPNIFKYLNKSISSMSEKITHKRQPVEKRQHNPSTNCLDTRTWHLSIYKLTNISPAWPRARSHRPKKLFSFSVLELSQPGPAGSSRPAQPDARPPDGQPWSAQHVRRQQ